MVNLPISLPQKLPEMWPAFLTRFPGFQGIGNLRISHRFFQRINRADRIKEKTTKPQAPHKRL
jgi:hypothetical protein